MFSNRVVIHPDYQGFGLGLKFINITAEYMVKAGYQVRATFSSYPLYKARLNDPKWKLLNIKKEVKTPRVGREFGRSQSLDKFRTKVKVYCFEYIDVPK